MKRWIVVLALVIGAVLFLPALLESNVSADGGPHGSYGTDVGGSGLPSQCGACHRVHQGVSTGKLLKAESPYALCLTCHNGTGSRLDVLDGVKLGATVSLDAAVIRSADTTDINVSVSPSAALSTGVGASNEFTIAVRNRTASAATVALAITAETNAGTGTEPFQPSTLSAASVNVPAANGTTGVPGVAYVTLTVTSRGSAAAAASNLTTVQATFNSLNASVKAQTRIGTAADNATANTLNGGGFRYIAGTAVTSRHNADPADNSLYPWGFNSNTGQNTNALTSPLQCTSCHNPHGTANYRLLKASVNSQTVVVRAYYNGAFTKDEGATGLDTGAPADKYTREYYGSAATGGAPTTADQGSLASLCGACHTAYPSTGASNAYNVGGVTHYRHKTEMPYTDWTNPETGSPSANNPETSPITGFPALRLASSTGALTGNNNVVTCLTCHRVHGTTSTMSNYALKSSLGGLADEDLSPAQTTGSRSVLLFTNNRGMCQACHQW